MRGLSPLTDDDGDGAVADVAATGGADDEVRAVAADALVAMRMCIVCEISPAGSLSGLNFIRFTR
ncbi:MAG: hypothetical protein U0105_26800 [Candidatus Obscuribacterales bacterium]